LPRSATALALTDVELVVVGRGVIRDTLQRADPFVHLLVTTLLDRLRAAQSGEHRSSPPPEGMARTMLIRNVTIEQELRHGLDNSEFEPFFQPIVELSTGDIAGFEALARWRKPARGLVPPLEFIGIAEQTGLICEIDHTVMTKAWALLEDAQQAVVNRAGKASPLFLAINIAAENFQDLSLVHKVRRLVEDSRLDPTLLKLEITESGLINSPEIAYRVLSDLSDMGVSIALDDFGTGYSSLSYLHRFPIDSLKIDRSFVSALATSERSRAIVKTIVGLAETMQLKLIAEGIEEEETAELLRQMGLRYGQGYLYSMPVAHGGMQQMLLQAAAA
jgi:EAL domain-containing protein (putative c-di-GMP-specific phosphodiesterase class I)